jgi:hypothetical protein
MWWRSAPHCCCSPPAQRQVTATVKLNSETVLVAPMQPPKSLPQANFDRAVGPKVAYSRRAERLPLPWSAMLPGRTIEFTGDAQVTGILPAAATQYAAPAEILLNVIRVGMLTAPPNGTEQRFVSEPVAYGTDYFQTLPAAKLVLVNYADVTLPRVIVRSGVTYDIASATIGGAYDGDMRHETLKVQIASGINMANQGLSSSRSSDCAGNPFWIAQHTLHHGQGVYTNGVQNHGLSGAAARSRSTTPQATS